MMRSLPWILAWAVVLASCAKLGLGGHAKPAKGPAAFGGTDAFLRQADWLVAACRASAPRPGASTVRLPGQRGLALRREQLDRGVALHEDVVPALVPWASKLNVALPEAL